MMERIAASSARPRGRITGVVYLLYFLTAIFGQLLLSRKVAVYGDAVSLISDALYIAVTLLFYYLFKPVNRIVSLAAAMFSLVGCAITVLSLFGRATTYSPLIFFGPYCALLGYLILRSTFLPRFLGVLMVFAGWGWLAFLSPTVAKHLSVPIEVLGITAEGLLMLWLLVKGVDVGRWKEQAH
jgi:Domain of unknown function (DUF4386)